MNASTTQQPRDTDTALIFSVLCLAVLALGMMAGQQLVQNKRMQSQMNAPGAGHFVSEASAEMETFPGHSPALQSAATAIRDARQEIGDASGTSKLPIAAQPLQAPIAAARLPQAASPGVFQRSPSAPIVLEKLIAVNGSLLASDAEFTRTLGRRLFFHTRSGPPLGIDVDALHPDMLRQLSLDADQLRVDQLGLDDARRMAAETAAKEREAHAKSERERLEAWRQARMEQQRQNATNGDHQVALAALKAMESASMRAQSPPPVIVVQPPAPVWTVPVIWTPICQPAQPFPQVPTTTTFTGNSSFRFIQQRDNAFDPFALGRRL